MAQWWQHAEPAKDPRYYPAPVPSAGVFDSPLVYIALNYQWLAHLDGLLSRLLYEDAWLGTQDDVDFAIQEVNKLLADLEATVTDEKAKISSNDTTAGYLEDKLLPGDNITLTKNNAGADETLTIAAQTFIVGEIRMFGFSPVPTGWKECSGSSVSRTTYAALFAQIGITFGAGDGSTTFNLPNLQGRSPWGRGSINISTLGNTGGETSHTLDVSEIPAHQHTIGYHTAGNGSGGGINVAASGTASSTSSVGGGGAHNNIHPVLALVFGIYAGA